MQTEDIEIANTADPTSGLPQVTVAWNEKTQQVLLNFNPSQFKTWGFLKFCLKSAVEQAEELQKQAEFQSMQQQAIQAQQQMAVMGDLRRKKVIH